MATEYCIRILLKDLYSRHHDHLSKNDAEAIKLYGADAVNGVIEMKAVRIINNSASTTKIDTEAGFRWRCSRRKYLTQNLNAATPVENGAPSGKYTVMILFQIDADGGVKT
jgi:hypothetical protein